VISLLSAVTMYPLAALEAWFNPLPERDHYYLTKPYHNPPCMSLV